MSVLSTGYSQSVIEWASDYRLTISNFQSPQTEINKELTSCSIISGASIDFGFQMSAYEFMLTKNFNSKVKATFNMNAAVITAPDSTTANQLVNFEQYNFDLTELYTRKFRQKMYEQKGAFSDFSFFKPIFEELQGQMNAESARVLKATDFGREEEHLTQEHQKVISQIEQLSDFCLACKPPKKRKKKD